MSEGTVVQQQLKFRRGLTVWRRGDGTVFKLAWTPVEIAFLRRESTFLKTLDGCGYTPHLIDARDVEGGLHRLLLEDLGDGEPVVEPWVLMRGASLLQAALHDRQIHHGDLTIRNIIVRGDVPYAIDFGEAKWYWEDQPPKRDGPDSIHLWPAIAAILRGES